MDEDAVKGALNLLRNCAEVEPGERLLVAFEAPEHGYYADGIVDCMVKAARSLGLETECIDVGFSPNAPSFSPQFKDATGRSDIVVFLARLGDQLRFSKMPPNKRMIVSYAISPEMFASRFGQIDHRAMLELKGLINNTLAESSEVRLTCPAGTDVIGHADPDLSAEGDTSVRRFPLSVHVPVPAESFSGRVALPGFLVGTGSRYYKPYSLRFEQPVHALFAEGRLTGFEGTLQDRMRAEAHYDYVATRYKIDRNMVHSWHAGIHPGCSYQLPAYQNFERWSGTAFGNPRLLHFHTCGACAPGEISWNILDPTILADGVAIYEDGRLCLERLQNHAELLDRFPDLADCLSSPATEVGLPLAPI